jgi:hypothetical protein
MSIQQDKSKVKVKVSKLQIFPTLVFMSRICPPPLLGGAGGGSETDAMHIKLSPNSAPLLSSPCLRPDSRDRQALMGEARWG